MRRIHLAAPDVMLVFGSNQAGRHGKGAALFAAEAFGARYGVGEGVSGRSYGIPTKDFNLRTLDLDAVSAAASRFISHAKRHQKVTFLVTRFGCGLAGYKDEEIAPLLKGAPANCVLPATWRRILNAEVDRSFLVMPEITDSDLLSALYIFGRGRYCKILNTNPDSNPAALKHLNGLQVAFPQEARSIQRYLPLLSNFADHILYRDPQWDFRGIDSKPLDVADLERQKTEIRRNPSVFSRSPSRR